MHTCSRMNQLIDIEIYEPMDMTEKRADYERLKGVVVAIITPYDERHNVNYSALRRLCSFLAGKGVDGLFVGGTTGEFPLLTMDERKKIAEIALDEIESKIQVVIHVGTAQMAATLELAKHAAEIGADGIGAVTPYYYKYDEKTLFNYYSKIAEAVEGMPVYLYSNPSLARNNISPFMVEDLVKTHANIVGIKSSSGSMENILDYLAVDRSEFSVITGCDRLFLCALMHGCAGVVTGSGGVFPEVYVRLYERFSARDYEGALVYQKSATAISKLMADGSYLDLIKKALRLRGIDVGSVRPPLRALSEGEELTHLKAVTELARKCNIKL